MKEISIRETLSTGSIKQSTKKRLGAGTPYSPYLQAYTIWLLPNNSHKI